MINPNELKRIVQDSYGQIAHQSKTTNQSSCCGATGCCSDETYQLFSEDYSSQGGYVADADLGLGCGIPTAFAGIRPGDHVLDLGSGAGNDCFVARQLTGETGFVTGLDFTPAMLEKARANQSKLGYTNMEFVEGDIESMPLKNYEMDVIISNCVLNLVPDKAKAFGEMYRVLRFGGHFCISDVVLTGELPYAIKQAATLYAGCVSGAIDRQHYLRLLRKQGFILVEVVKEKEVVVPDEILSQYLDAAALEQFKQSDSGIFSITVRGYKPIHIKPVISIAQEEDHEAIDAILAETGLPAVNWEDENTTFFVIRYKEKAVACIGLETCSNHAGLLRSMATLPAYRTQKLAQMLHDHLLRDSRLNGLESLYLLTTTAEKWFLNHGWHAIDRQTAPQEIKDTSECKTICPDSAMAMRLIL